MTVDDGSTMDSRQPVRGDAASFVTGASLATSLLWWVTASSLVDRLLDNSGVDPFALVIGNRSVVELRQDGTLRRTGLRSLLLGGTSTVELIRTSRGKHLPRRYMEGGIVRSRNGQNMGMVGFDRGMPGKRWRFLNGNEYYLTQATSVIGAAVVVDTSESMTGGDRLFSARYRALEQRRLYDSVILVLPHTHRTEMLIRGYLAWVQAGRPADEGYQPLVTSQWDPTLPPNPIRYTCPIPIQAAFGVTGLAQGGEWRDPSDLEAARTLLRARYDLKIGIWDLTGNPTLRRTLLETLPATRSPAEVLDVPSGPAQRAKRRVDERVEARAGESAARLTIAKRLKPLREHGWRHTARRSEQGRYRAGRRPLRLSLTEALPRWPGSEPRPLVFLSLQIEKRQSSVAAFTTMYNDGVNISKYVRARREAFERIAAPDGGPLGEKHRNRIVIWQAQGGWADHVDWAKRAIALAKRTEAWRKEFKNLCDECRRIHQQRFRPGS